MEAQNKEKTKQTADRPAKDRKRTGTVKIADDVVAMIAALAALEVDGVSAMAGGVKSDYVGRLSRSRLAKCVKVTVDKADVKVDMAIMLDYGFNIPSTSAKVQAKVKSSIENMTGLNVTGVNVRIAEITMPQTSQGD